MQSFHLSKVYYSCSKLSNNYPAEHECFMHGIFHKLWVVVSVSVGKIVDCAITDDNNSSKSSRELKQWSIIIL